MADLSHPPTRTRGRPGSVARLVSWLPPTVRLFVWQLEDRVLPAASDLFAGLLPDGPGAIPIPVPAEARGLPAGALALPFLAAGSLGSAPPVVRFNDPLTGAQQFPFVPFDSDFTGGVRLAVGDVNGDGTPDLITGAGPGGESLVRVIDGRTGDQLAGPLGNFTVFEAGFLGGVSVAAADMNRDGFADVIVSAGLGGGPRVRVFSGADGSVLNDYFTADEGQRYGLTVAAADVNRDGYPDLIAGTGIGAAAEVAVFSGRDRSQLARFFAFEPDFTRGVSLAAADVTGDGAADIVVGAGFRGSPRVRVFDGVSGAVVQDFFAFDSSSRGGVSVAATDVNGDGRPELVTGAGPGGGSRVRVLDAATLAEVTSYAAYSAPFDTAGVVVAGR